MNKTTAFLVLLLVVEFYLFWRLDIALKRSKPVCFTEKSGRTRPHNLFRAAIAVMGAVCVLTTGVLFLSDVDWFRRLGSGLAFLVIGVLIGRNSLPQNNIKWDANRIEGPQFSWRHPIVPKRISIKWEDIWEVKTHRGRRFVTDKSQNKRVGWTGAYLGCSFLNKHLVAKRPDLFYPPYYLEPIPRGK